MISCVYQGTGLSGNQGYVLSSQMIGFHPKSPLKCKESVQKLILSMILMFYLLILNDFVVTRLL